MTNVLIRGLSESAVARIDAEASAQDLSRNEYLRRTLESGMESPPTATLTEQDWMRAAATFADLADSDIVDAAWP